MVPLMDGGFGSRSSCVALTRPRGCWVSRNGSGEGGVVGM